MARPKKVVEKEEEVFQVVPEMPTMAPFSPAPIAPLSIDLGREDLNTVVKKVNEIIDLLSQSK